MNIKSSQALVNEATKEIKTLTAKEVKLSLEKDEITLIDIRDIRELWKEGAIKKAIHIPRGMLEFWLDPESSYFKELKIGEAKNIVLFCALGMRSALGAKSLQDMGFKNVAHVNGGFDSLKVSGIGTEIKKRK
jgi:rhodanese-related sulfurtransferase|tara:strand:+ start:1400 stop:1798 length:399 start_codon:yes stop_codon:yes gene_type:complete